MASSQCASTTIQGFPLTLKQNLFKPWATCPDKDTKTPDEIMRTLTTTSDLTVGWSENIPKGTPLGTVVRIGTFTRIVLPPSLSGFNSTLTFGGTRYTASPYISILRIQHANLLKHRPNDATVELIWAFQKEQSKIATEDPQVILICRPAKFSNRGFADPFWDAVNASLADSNKDKTLSTNYSLKSIFPIRSTVVYQVCLNSKVSNSYGTSTVTSPFKLRVYVINDTLEIPNPSRGTATSVGATCPALVDYTLITGDGSNGPASIVNTAPQYGIFQFVTGSSSSTAVNLKVPKITGNYISDWTSVQQYLKIQLPDEEYRFSTGDGTDLPGVTPRQKKKFKCYTIDPQKDIVGDQITIDPKTGQPLEEYMREEDYGSSDGGIQVPGILPGDIEWYIQHTVGIIGALVLLAYFFYWLRMLIIGVSSPDGWPFIQSAGMHFILWAALLTGLIFAERAMEKKEGFTDSKIIVSKDKRCYTTITNSLIGTQVTIKKGPKADKTIISYTKDECENQMGGFYKAEEIESGDVDPDSFTGPIGFCYSVDPKVTIPLSTQDYSMTICAPKEAAVKPRVPNRQCYMPSSSGPLLIGKEMTLTKLGVEKFKPLTTIISYTTDECNRLAGIYKKITVPSTFVTSDGPGGPSMVDIGFCYRSGSDLSKQDVDVKLNYSYTCSPRFSSS